MGLLAGILPALRASKTGRASLQPSKSKIILQLILETMPYVYLNHLSRDYFRTMGDASPRRTAVQRSG